MRFFITLLFLMIVAPGTATAQLDPTPPLVATPEEPVASLYMAAPPEGMAFVRFFNAEDKPMSAMVGGVPYNDVPPHQASVYRLHLHGKIDFMTGLKSVPYVLESGAFYTVVSDDAGNPFIHKDMVSDDPSRAMLVLYNLSSAKPLSLKAQDSLVTVVDNVGIGKSAFRGISASEVGLSVAEPDGKIIHRFEPAMLEAGRTYSIFFVRGDTVMIKGETGTSD